MILQALRDYYLRISHNCSDLEPEGFKRVAIPFIINLNKDGHITGIYDTRETANRNKGVPRMVPKIFEGSRTSNVKANLLWDKASYVFGVGDPQKTKRLKQQQEEFHKTIQTYFPQTPDVGVIAVLNFLSHHADEIKQSQYWEDISSKDAVVGFRLDGDCDMLICNRPAVMSFIEEHITASSQEIGFCAVTGSSVPLARLENPIKGLRGSGKAESHLVAFNESAYWSYGSDDKKRGENFPIGKSASSAYVAAINYLQREGSRQYLRNADATVIFWAEKEHQLENWFADFFGEPPKGQSDQDNAAIKALYGAPKTGAVPLLDDKTSFYVLGLAPNAARIAIRFWYQGSVGEVSGYIKQHFDDIALVHGPKEPEHLSLFRLLV